MKIETIPISQIQRARYNPRKTLKPGDSEAERMTIAHWELTESELATHVLGLPRNSQPSTAAEIVACNRVIARIHRAVIAGELKKIRGTEYFERREAEKFAQKLRHIPKGLERYFESWHPPDQSDCRWLLCGLDPEGARSQDEIDAVWNQVSDAEEAVRRALHVGRLAFIAKPEVSDGDRLYQTGRYIRAGELLRWALECGSFPRFVALARRHGLRPARTEKSTSADRPKRPRSFSKREKIIRAAIRANKSGKDYADDLDGRGLMTPENWQNRTDDPCPKRYSLAYEDPYWREMIHKEKSRIGSRMKR
jgi:hypothetical protein